MSKLKSTVYEGLSPIPSRTKNKIVDLLNEDTAPVEPLETTKDESKEMTEEASQSQVADDEEAIKEEVGRG